MENIISSKILLLHGMGGTGALWRPISAALEDEYEILAPDQRGHGKKIIPHVPGGRAAPSYTPLDYGRDLVEMLEGLSFHPTWVVGHSMGVRSACALAHLKPSWVCGLVLIDLGFSGQAGGGLGDELGHFLKILPHEFKSREEARKFMQAHCPDPAIAQYLLAVSVQNAEGQTTFPFDHAALIATIEAAKHSSVRKWVRELASKGMPILVLRGANSLVWSAEEFETEKKAFADLPSIEWMTLQGAGHGLPFEKRLEFIQILKDWMERHKDRRSPNSSPRTSI